MPQAANGIAVGAKRLFTAFLSWPKRCSRHCCRSEKRLLTAFSVVAETLLASLLAERKRLLVTLGGA